MRPLPRLVRSILGAVLGFMLLAGVAFAVQKVYYAAAPGSWFLNYYYIHVDDAEIGEEVPVTLCRKVRYTDFKLNATRTFLYVQTNGKMQQVGEYELSPTIEARDNPCAVIPIKTSRQPQRAGTYQICTSGNFIVEGNRKTLKPYCSNTYRLNATVQSIKGEIQRLQDRIAELEKSLTGDSQ